MNLHSQHVAHAGKNLSSNHEKQEKKKPCVGCTGCSGNCGCTIHKKPAQKQN